MQTCTLGFPGAPTLTSQGAEVNGYQGWPRGFSSSWGCPRCPQCRRHTWGWPDTKQMPVCHGVQGLRIGTFRSRGWQDPKSTRLWDARPRDVCVLRCRSLAARIPEAAALGAGGGSQSYGAPLRTRRSSAPLHRFPPPPRVGVALRPPAALPAPFWVTHRKLINARMCQRGRLCESKRLTTAKSRREIAHVFN